jgi:hypothetical protein
MRDDNTVSRFRLRTFWFKILIALWLFILGTCGVSIYGLLYFKDQYLLAAQNLEARQNELNETKVKLQDRNNLAVLPYGDPSPGNIASAQSYALNNVVQPFRSAGEHASPINNDPAQIVGPAQLSGSAVSSGVPLAPVQRSDQSSSPADNAATALTSVQSNAPENSQGNSQANAQGRAEDRAVKPALEDVQSLLGQSGPVTVAGPSSTGAAPGVAASHPVQISNLSASVEAGNKLRISFGITNIPQRTTFAGNCTVFAITKQGAEVELLPVIRGSLTFRIGRFKSMQAVLSLPGKISPSDFSGLRINVIINDLPPYWMLFPISL